MKRIFLFLICVLFANQVFARVHQFRGFANSLSILMGIDSTRLVQISDSVYLASPSLLQDWGIINQTASASYNDLSNTLILSKELIKKQEIYSRVKTVEELAIDSPLLYVIKIGEIFHELGHAEMDIFIEESKDDVDAQLFKTIKNEIYPWFQLKYPEENKKKLMHELLGYFRGQIIENFFREQSDVYIQNGFNIFSGKCYFSKREKAFALISERAEFSKLHLFYKNNNFKDDLNPGYIFVDAEAYSLKDFPQKWIDDLWYHFVKVYNPIKNTSELVDHLNTYSPHKQVFEACRNAYWDEVH